VGRLAAWIAGGLVVFLVLITAAAAGVVSSVFGGGADGGGCLGAVTTPGATPAGLSGEQVRNASVIVAVGERMRVPVRGWVIAVATALQESDLINTGGGPDDSLGLLQQRPSQGWGTPDEVMNLDYAAGKFYEHLLAVSGWQNMPLTEAAQRVQRSAYPDAYAKHEARATEIVSAVGSGGSWAIPLDLEQCLGNCPAILSNTPIDLQSAVGTPPQGEPHTPAFVQGLLKISGSGAAQMTRNGQNSALGIAHPVAEPTSAFTGGTLPTCDGAAIAASGWTRPVAGTVGSGFRTPDRPGHDGVDIMAVRGTVIHAASGGVVVRVRCNIVGHSWDAPFSFPMPCDRDGYPGLGGCGWYVEIRHAADIVSRYCHMVRQPIVHVGQTVTAGQPIGNVGTSGNSSGPHLHYEIHEGYPATEANAINPVPFMRQKGVPL
jgi:murein DD-endopeptidase MepM/ murein hydrolase activator NlpD